MAQSVGACIVLGSLALGFFASLRARGLRRTPHPPDPEVMEGRRIPELEERLPKFSKWQTEAVPR